MNNAESEISDMVVAQARISGTCICCQTITSSLNTKALYLSNMRPKTEHEISFNSRLGSFLHISLVIDAEVSHEPKMILWMTRGSGAGRERGVGLGLATSFGLCYCAFDFFFFFSTTIRSPRLRLV